MGVISPFNFPLPALKLKSVAPALALGNAVVLKPHQNTPIAGGTLLAKIFEEAGCPAACSTSSSPTSPRSVTRSSSTPSRRSSPSPAPTRSARHVATVCARHFKRSVLELGGNSALVVLDDAALDYAVDAAVFSRFVHQGQVCMAANRVLVDASVADEFTEKFVAKVRSLKVGDPRDPETVIGPVINSAQANAISGTVEQALAEGATALVRGSTTNNLVEPTVLTGVPADSALLRQEVFGPVVFLVPFDGEEEAVRIVNDTPYGLSGAVHTGDIERGRGLRQADRHRHVPRERRHRPRRADRALRRREALRPPAASTARPRWRRSRP